MTILHALCRYVDVLKMIRRETICAISNLESEKNNGKIFLNHISQAVFKRNTMYIPLR